MYTNVLCPFDGSNPAMHAVEAAVELVKGDTPASVTVLCVTSVNDTTETKLKIAARLAGIDVRDGSYKGKPETQEKVQAFFAALPENVDLQIAVMGGHPQDVIVDAANEGDYDCIAMGRRGLGAISAAFGSVSTAVLRNVELPVLVVK